MTLDEALDRAPVYERAYSLRVATGTDGTHWFWAFFHPSGRRWAREVSRNPRGFWTTSPQTVDPPQEADWVPDLVEPDS